MRLRLKQIGLVPLVRTERKELKHRVVCLGLHRYPDTEYSLKLVLFGTDKIKSSSVRYSAVV